MSLKEHTIQRLCRSRPGYNEKRVLAWHFLRSGKLSLHSNAVRPRLLNGDQAPVKVSRRTYQLQGRSIQACFDGLHASEKILDAAQYCTADWICRVEVWGDLDKKLDKICGRYRRVLWIMKATDVLTQMAWDLGKRRLRRIKTRKRQKAIIESVLAMEGRGTHLSSRRRRAMAGKMSKEFEFSTNSADTLTQVILNRMLNGTGMQCLRASTPTIDFGWCPKSDRNWVNRELPKRFEKARK